MDKSKLPEMIKKSQDLINPFKRKKKRKKVDPLDKVKQNMRKKRRALRDADDY